MGVTVFYQYPSDNVAGAYSTIGVNTGSEDPDYPAANLVDGRPGRPAKLTTGDGSWVLDFGAPQRIDLVALGPHNLAAATLEGHSANVWTAPDFAADFVIEAPSADGHSRNAWLDLTQVPYYSASGFRYWRLVVSTGSGGPDAAVGEVWLSAALRTMPRAYALGFTVSEVAPSILHRTEFLVPMVYALGSRERRLALTFRLTEAGAATLREWYRAMQGPGLTGLFVPDAAVNDAWWVRHAGEYAEDVAYRDVRDVKMTLIEHASGVPL